MQEIYSVTQEHVDMLDAIQGQGVCAQSEYMDTIARNVIESGGVCDEKTFLHAYFATYQRPDTNYIGGMPDEIKSAMGFAKWLQPRIGTPVATLEIDPYVDRPRVPARPAGVVIGTGQELSPVISFDIQEIDDKTGYTGIVSFDVLWTPKDSKARRVEDVSDDDVTDHDILIVERLVCSTEVRIIEMHKGNEEMMILLGNEQIKRASQAYEAEVKRAFEKNQHLLRMAARIMDFPIS